MIKIFMQGISIFDKEDTYILPVAGPVVTHIAIYIVTSYVSIVCCGQASAGDVRNE